MDQSRERQEGSPWDGVIRSLKVTARIGALIWASEPFERGATQDSGRPHDPSPTRAAYFDREQNAWVLSPYRRCRGGAARALPVAGERQARNPARVPRRDGPLANSAPRCWNRSPPRGIEAWRPRLQALTREHPADTPTDRPVDLLQEFTLPWGLSLAMLVTEAEPTDRERLRELGTPGVRRHRSGAMAMRHCAPTRRRPRRNWKAIFEDGRYPMGEPTFVALSQTFPRLLANCWLALLRHPEEFARLRAHPELMPGAIEELLRYAGIVRRVFRRATADIEIGGVRIAGGELAVLMLASANRDPEQFPDPDRLRRDARPSPTTWRWGPAAIPAWAPC